MKKSIDYAMQEFRPKVDYSLRPAKATVRRMVIETLAQLNPLVPVKSYRYIGMGSIYFRDFLMVHRQLGIAEMITIEGNAVAEERVRFNLPLACIRLILDSTTKALPQIDLENVPSIIWLDYESRVNQSVLADVEEIVGRCASGSVLIVSVNVERPAREQRDAWLSEVEAERLMLQTPTNRDHYRLLSYLALEERVRSVLDSRNGGVPKSERVEFHQMFHMVYADGAPMLTFGGALVDGNSHTDWVECGIESFQFTRSSVEPYDVRIPRLTRREVHYLLSNSPDVSGNLKAAASKAGIPTNDAIDFAATYRHAPLFVEAEHW